MSRKSQVKFTPITFGKNIVNTVPKVINTKSSNNVHEVKNEVKKNDTTVAAVQRIPQASITLRDCNTTLCNVDTSTTWDLTVTHSGPEFNPDGTDTSIIIWNIDATKSVDPNIRPLLYVNGFLSICNSGEGPAYIGNIVVNLQTRVGRNWVTYSSDIADTTNGNNATSARICSSGSSEGKSIFTKNAFSGTINFTDASNNTLFNVVPQFVLDANQCTNLFYTASFISSGLAVGQEVRIEVIVTFSNAGARGGSGASCINLDVNGNGFIDLAESFVRSVPCRTSAIIPLVEKCNESVLLRNSIGTEDGTIISRSTTIGNGSGSEVITDSVTRSVVITVPNTPGRYVDTAELISQGSAVVQNGPLDPITGIPIFSHTFVCCPELYLIVSDAVDVSGFGGIGDPEIGEYCTYTQGGWGSTPNGTNPGTILRNNFATVYPSGTFIGLLSSKYIKFSSAEQVRIFLPQGGTAGFLTKSFDTIVNGMTTSAGVLAGQTLALQLNVDFGDAGIIGNDFPLPTFGDLFLTNLEFSELGLGYSQFNGINVRTVLAITNEYLGKGISPTAVNRGINIPNASYLNNLVTLLNESFVDCNMSLFAAEHLKTTIDGEIIL
ncbi:Ig family protein [Tupanvirus deep ocean]|uniref:Ig family protein n=2 Tax=Tupanvirus TaxID=2094720 RepID=A0AC62A9V5_9VIRU|nr:Ig family protein [Tupanvirus deep ocean]QKU34541.1 Ig family protein [Tupanvirus deep ocean]